MTVDPSNVSQAESWDGEGGAFWAANAEQFDLAMGGFQAPFLAAAQIGPASRVLDFGCGTGQCTRDAARLASSGTVLGVDISTAQLDLGRRVAAAEGLANVTFTRADVQVHPFPSGAFDVALSRMGSMFFGDPNAAFANLARAVAPDGRLVLLVWQGIEGNEWFREIMAALDVGRDLPPPPPGAPGPFALADPALVRDLLIGAGFAEPDFEPLNARMDYGPDVEAAYTLVSGLAGWRLDGLDEEGRAAGLAALRASLEAHAGPNGVTYDSAAWLITAIRP